MNTPNDGHLPSGNIGNKGISAERRRFLVTVSRTAATAPAVALLLAAGMKPRLAQATIYSASTNSNTDAWIHNRTRHRRPRY